MSHQDLTERQRDCLRLAAGGMGHQQIGRQLLIGHGTVEAELARARAKLGARNTAHAVGIAMHHGIVTAEHLGLRADA